MEFIGPRTQTILRYNFFVSLWILFCLILLAPMTPAQTAPASRQILPLNTGWQFRQMDTPNAEWRPATVPGDVHLDLLANKVVPDPFYRDNEAKLQWISQAGWEYQTTITATRTILARKHIDLVFDGLDTYAQVYLDGHLLLTADNMFRQWHVDLKPYLKQGANTLHIVFPPPDKVAHERASQDRWSKIIQAADKTYIRRAAYEYGWDWGPTFVTSGIWRPASLSLWDGARIDDLHIRQSDISAAVARLNAQVQITSDIDTAAIIRLTYTQDGKKVATTRTVALHRGDNTIDVPVEISKPALWFPAGYGAHPIYEFTAELSLGAHLVDKRTTRTGLRSVVLERDRDKWGRSFEIVVNGIPIFAKGADVIPFDSFPSRVTTATYRHILQSAVDANMNMIRHWGGGYYESDEFYQICDELGLMVWQDFMFGNEWQPGAYDFKQNVEKEAEYQVTRLRNHPSIVLWCGNNETEISWNWGQVTKIHNALQPESRRRMWEDYLTVFSGILPRTVARLAPETPYWPSSPSADYEDVSDTYASGDMHDWNVWHGRVPFTEYEEHHGRFLTEYGFQSFPQLSTIDAFTLPEDRTSIFTPVMLGHQKNNEGNSLIQDYMLKDYTEPKDFPSFLYASQVLQAEGIKIGAEHHRRERPRTMGSIFWQLNDCWPVASWSSIDYYGNWKALQYYARRFFSPILVSPHIESNALAVYVVDDHTSPAPAHLRVRIMDFSGKVLDDHEQDLKLAPLASKIYYQEPLPGLLSRIGVDASTVFVATDLTIDNHTVSTNLIYLVPTKQIRLPQAEISHAIARDGSAYTLTLSSKVLARGVYVTFGSSKVEVSDNYLNLLPNTPQTITLQTSASLEDLNKSLRIVSLVDAFPQQQQAKR
ncbi:beta-mannosidase [Edaphobacter bradus]|uniref:beta-mannosidase n=1 Tax=Edaphobacter bradus TaxID=2259016 RepID=UPI0021DF5F74|nr:glycoside hydrolase family 2 protein [Edaphobacter bradus]